MPDPSLRIAEMRNHRALLGVLRQLPTNQRAAIVLRHYAGYGTDEIATVLGIGRATVRAGGPP